MERRTIFNSPVGCECAATGELGKKLLNVLLDRIAHPRQKTQTIDLQSKLIIRQTT